MGFPLPPPLLLGLLLLQGVLRPLGADLGVYGGAVTCWAREATTAEEAATQLGQ
jgi:hypothetical protein